MIAPAPGATVAGIIDFQGPVVTAESAEAGDLSGCVACIGSDRAMIALVPALVRLGLKVKVFEDRARLILPAGIGLPGTGVGLRLLASGASRSSRLVAAVAGHRASALIDWEVARLYRLSSELHRRHKLQDRWVRRQMKPWPGDPRPALVSNAYYESLNQPNCQLISWPIAGIAGEGVRTCDGLVHRVDAIVLAGTESAG